MRDIEAFARQNVSDGPERARAENEVEVWSTRAGGAVDLNAVDAGISRGRSDNVNVMTSALEPFGQVVQMKLEPSDSRMIPIGYEGNLHRADGGGKRRWETAVGKGVGIRR
jgi:hypothetical protein